MFSVITVFSVDHVWITEHLRRVITTAGNITKRSKGVYLVRIALGQDAQGKRQTLTKTIHGSREDAEKYLTEVLRERDLGQLAPQRHHPQTFQTVAQKWLTMTLPKVAPRTQHDYQYLTQKILLPHFGTMPLVQITAGDLEDHLYAVITDHGLRTARYCQMLLHQIFKRAIRDGIIPRNLVSDVSLPKEKPAPFYVIPPADRSRFVEAAKHLAYYGPFILLLFSAGLRPSEGMGLYWKDWDATTNIVHVQYTLDMDDRHKYVRKAPKTPQSRRAVPLPDWMRPILQTFRQQLTEGGYTQEWMFPTQRRGGPINRRNFLKRIWKPFLQDLGLPDTMRLYDLRHTHATMLLEADVHPRVVSERLGHTSVRMTLERYSHVLPHVQEAAIQALNQFGE